MLILGNNKGRANVNYKTSLVDGFEALLVDDTLTPI